MGEGAETLVDDLLLMAIWFHGGRTRTVQGQLHPVASGHRVIKQALLWRGEWSESADLAMREQRHQHNVGINSMYQRLISMCRLDSSETLVVGSGMLGDASTPPAGPQFVAFALTEFGHERAIELCSRHPELRSYVEAPPDNRK